MILLLALVACSAPPELTVEQKTALRNEIRARIARMPDELKLTQEQYHATRPIVAEMQEGVLKAALKARESGKSLSTAMQLKKDLKKVRSDTEAKLDPILTDDQMKVVKSFFDDIRTIVKNARSG